jgi:PAP2 superfamily
MRRTALLGILMPVSVGLAGIAPVTGNGLATVQADHASMVVDWNLTMLSTFASVNLPPPVASRDGAIVQAAVFDAVNGIKPRYAPIHVASTAPRGASRAAAAANAAYTSLVSLFPAQKVSLDAALQASLGTITEDEEDDNRSIALGLAWGKTVADDIVAWRAGDGFSTPPPPYIPGTALGDWQPTPDANGVPGSGPPKFRSLATTVPFALTSPSQFRPAGPPALDSARYAQDYNEVKSLGSKTGSARNAFQTQTAVFWQLDTPLAMWDRVADTLAEHHRKSLLENARVLALVNLALADATIAIWDAKNAFNTWRPVTAINTVGGFGNSATTPEPGWLPLLATPYFQEYPSAHSGVSSAAASVLATIFGQDTTFTVTSAGLPGVVRTFNGFDEAVAQVADARVYAGFHFRFSCDDAIQMGKQVARQVESKLMLRLHGAPENEGD